MTALNRRRFLHLAGGATALSALTPSIARAGSIPANHRTGTLRDVEHIVASHDVTSGAVRPDIANHGRSTVHVTADPAIATV